MTLIQFDVDSGARISGVVRYVENEANRRGGLNFEPAPMPPQKFIRICSVTGTWAINSSKVVQFKNQTVTPNTVSATNLFFPIHSTSRPSYDCAIARDGTAWYLIDVPMRTATAVFVTGTTTQPIVSSAATSSILFVSGTALQSIVSDISLSASLNTSNCTISIGRTLTTSNVSVVTGTTMRAQITSFSTALITVATQTATSAYLQMDL